MLLAKWSMRYANMPIILMRNCFIGLLQIVMGVKHDLTFQLALSIPASDEVNIYD